MAESEVSSGSIFSLNEIPFSSKFLACASSFCAAKKDLQTRLEVLKKLHTFLEYDGFVYAKRKKLLEGQSALLDCWKKCLDDINLIVRGREEYYETIIRILKRDEFSLATLTLGNSKKELAILARFRQLFISTVCYVQQKFRGGLAGVGDALLSFSCQVVAFAALRVPPLMDMLVKHFQSANLTLDVSASHLRDVFSELRMVRENQRRSRAMAGDADDDLQHQLEDAARALFELRPTQSLTAILVLFSENETVASGSISKRLMAAKKMELVDAETTQPFFWDFLKFFSFKVQPRAHFELISSIVAFCDFLLLNPARVGCQRYSRMIWTLSPYGPMVSSVVAALQCCTPHELPRHVVETSVLLCSRDIALVDVFMHVVFHRTNVHILEDVMACTSIFEQWFRGMRLLKNGPAGSCPHTFDTDFFLKAMDIILSNFHYGIVEVGLVFLYQVLPLLAANDRLRVINEVVLTNSNFYSLFLHWHDGLRQEFYKLLCYRLIGLSPDNPFIRLRVIPRVQRRQSQGYPAPLPRSTSLDSLAQVRSLSFPLHSGFSALFRNILYSFIRYFFSCLPSTFFLLLLLFDLDWVFSDDYYPCFYFQGDID